MTAPPLPPAAEVEAAAAGAVEAGRERPPVDCLDQAATLLAGVREEIARADGKAAILLGAVGATGAALIAVLAGRQWSPDQLPAVARVLWWFGAVCWTASLLFLLGVVLPRPLRSRWRPGEPITYFGDVARADHSADLHAALTLMARDPLPRSSTPSARPAASPWSNTVASSSAPPPSAPPSSPPSPPSSACPDHRRHTHPGPNRSTPAAGSARGSPSGPTLDERFGGRLLPLGEPAPSGRTQRKGRTRRGAEGRRRSDRGCQALCVTKPQAGAAARPAAPSREPNRRRPAAGRAERA